MESTQNTPHGNNSPTPSAVSVKPSAATILKNLPTGETPMDVLNNIMQRGEPEPFNPQKVADNIRAEREQAADNLPDPIHPQSPDSVDSNVASPLPPEELIPEPQSSKPSTEDLLTLKDNAAENFKKLRTSLSETKKALKEKEDALLAKQAALEEYETGKKVPDFVFEKEKRIAELERFEKLHSLKTSREYTDNYIKPIEAIKEKLHAIGKEYEVPEEVVDQAIGITNRRELNKFLRDHFEDLDAIEVKRLVDEAQGLSRRAQEAEMEPAKVLAEMQQKSEALYREQELERRKHIADNSRKAWMDSLTMIRKEGKAIELIAKPDDTEYNAKYVEPITKAAATEYGKIVSKLGELGLKDLPDDLAFALARMTQLAHASAVSLETRSKALDTVENVLRNTQRMNRFERPPVGEAYAGGNGALMAQKPETREDRVQSLINKGREFAKGR